MGAGAKLGMKAISIAIGIPVGIVTKRAVAKAWAAVRPNDPPRQPKEAGVNWSDAIAWAALSGAGIVVAELITQASAQAAFRALTGNEPPPPKPTKAQKKLEKAEEGKKDAKKQAKKAAKR